MLMGPRRVTVVTGQLPEGEIPYEEDSVPDLCSRRCRARDECETCFEGSEWLRKASESTTSLRGCCDVPSRLSSALNSLGGSKI